MPTRTNEGDQKGAKPQPLLLRPSYWSQHKCTRNGLQIGTTTISTVEQLTSTLQFQAFEPVMSIIYSSWPQHSNRRLWRMTNKLMCWATNNNKVGELLTQSKVSPFYVETYVLVASYSLHTNNSPSCFHIRSLTTTTWRSQLCSVKQPWTILQLVKQNEDFETFESYSISIWSYDLRTSTQTTNQLW